MMARLSYKFLLALLAYVTIVGSNSSARALGPQGITVSPAFQQVSISADESQKKIPFSVTNDKLTAQTLQISFSDFNTLNETGGLFFVGSNPTTLQKKYGLAKWISIDPSTITLQPHQTLSLNAIVQNLPTLASGGHYGALNLAVTTNQLQSLSNNVAIHPVASTLIFLTKTGGDTHKLKLVDVSYSKNVFKLPSQLTLRFNNYGNTHLIPRGVATLTGPNNKVVSRGIINQDSGLILPETFRRYGVSLQTISSATASGNYKLSIAYGFDGFDGFRDYQTSLYHVSTLASLAIFILIVAILVATLKRKSLAKFLTSIKK